MIKEYKKPDGSAFGIVFIGAGLLAGIAAFVLRPGNGAKKKAENYENRIYRRG